MAVLARHFGYKPASVTYNFTGYTEHGARLVVQDNFITPFNGGDGVPGQEFAGFEWTMGPDEDRFHSIICYTAEVNDGLTAAFNTEGTIGTEGYVPGDAVEEYGFDGGARKLAFKGIVNQADFLGVANGLGIGTFTNDADAVAAINNTSLGAWTNYDGVNNEQGSGGEGGPREDGTFYYSIVGCGNDTKYILKSGAELVRGESYNTGNMIMSPEVEFLFDVFTVDKAVAEQAHQLEIGGNVVLQACEG